MFFASIFQSYVANKAYFRYMDDMAYKGYKNYRGKNDYTNKRRPARKDQWNRRKKDRSKKTILDIELKPQVDRNLEPYFRQIGSPASSTFAPDDFQVKAVELVEENDVLVSATTGSGKTWIAIQATAKLLKHGGRVWYASPLKALSNSKLMEFEQYFGKDKVGIITGDRKENTSAPLVVGTTEILRNQLYDAMYSGENIQADLVVMDEAHYLGDAERGVVWEEVLIYLPTRVRLLLLSATISNPSQIASWLKKIRGKTIKIVEQTKRPVPLQTIFIHPSGKLHPFTDDHGELSKKMREYLAQSNPPILSAAGQLPPCREMVKVMQHFDLLSTIFFMKSRKDCDQAVESWLQQDSQTSPKHERNEQFLARLSEILKRFPFLRNHPQLPILKKHRVAAHHSGHLPLWKILVEILMAEGFLDAIFATSTVAAGVDFPARTVVLLNSDRFNGKQFMPLSATQFTQMTGRAGRRGKDNIGFVMLVPGQFMNLHHIQDVVQAPPEHLVSQMNLNFSMVLNLLLSMEPGQIKWMLERSYASYLEQQNRKAARSKSKNKRKKKPPSLQLWRSFLKYKEFLNREGYVDQNDFLTDDGHWTSNLRIDEPLLIAECIRWGILPENDPVLLAALVAPFTYDREPDGRFSRVRAPNWLRYQFNKMIRVIEPLIIRKKESGFSTNQISFKIALTVYLWASGKPWKDVSLQMEMAEGDLCMLILRTIDNLRQIASLEETHPDVAGCAFAAIDTLMREPVSLL